MIYKHIPDLGEVKPELVVWMPGPHYHLSRSTDVYSTVLLAQRLPDSAKGERIAIARYTFYQTSL